MILGGVALVSGGARAATYLFYAPQVVSLGAGDSEVYVPLTFEAHDGLAGASLGDAGLKELGRLLPPVQALNLMYRGTIVEITLTPAQREDPGVADRALGAAFHTLSMAGMTEIRIDGQVVTAGQFSRGAMIPVLPLPRALPPQRLGHGLVDVGGTPVPAAEFYRRLAAADPRIQDAARMLLGNGVGPSKLLILQALPELRFKDVTLLLLPLLRDPDPGVRVVVLRMLRGTRSPVALNALEEVAAADSNPEVKIAAVKILVAAGRNEFDKYLLLEKLSSSDAALVIDAAKALLQTGDATLATAFMPLLDHTSPEVRAAGVQGLTTLKRFDLLQNVLGQEKLSKELREDAAKAMAELATGAQQSAAVSWLIENASEQEAAEAAELAGKRRLPGTTDALVKALKRPEVSVRKRAASALGVLRDASTLEAMAAAIQGTAESVEAEHLTQHAIAIIAAQPLDQVIRISKSPDPTIRELAIKSLSAFAQERPNPKVVAVLKETLKDKEKGIRRAAVFALARIPDDAVLHELIAMRGDPDSPIRAQIVVALTASKRPDGDKVLLEMLGDVDHEVKLQVVKGLRARKVTSALEKLRWMVEYRHAGVRREVVGAVAEMVTPADPAFFELFGGRLYDEDPAVRIIAIDALAVYTLDPRTAQTIGGAVSDRDAGVKTHALEVLSKSTDPSAVEQVIRGLFDRDKQIRLRALDALEKLKSEKAVKALLEFVVNETDPEVKQRATQVIEIL
jgi:HEAT repeat protein